MQVTGKIIAISADITKLTKPAIILVAGFLLGCSQSGETSKEIAADNPVKIEPQSVTVETEAEEEREDYSFDANCDATNKRSVESGWPEKLKRLSNLDSKYELISRGSVDFSRSIFNEPNIATRNEYNKFTFNISNFEHLMQQVVRSETIFVKGTKDLGGRLYPRATIEEYVFTTRDCAKTAEKYLHWVNENVSQHTTRWKYLAKISRDGQIIYYIVGGGSYMSERLPAIEAAVIGSGE